MRLSVRLVEGNQPSVRHNALTKDEDRKHMCACAYTGSLTFYTSIHDNVRLYIKINTRQKNMLDSSIIFFSHQKEYKLVAVVVQFLNVPSSRLKQLLLKWQK